VVLFWCFQSRSRLEHRSAVLGPCPANSDRVPWQGIFSPRSRFLFTHFISSHLNACYSHHASNLIALSPSNLKSFKLLCRVALQRIHDTGRPKPLLSMHVQPNRSHGERFERSLNVIALYDENSLYFRFWWNMWAVSGKYEEERCGSRQYTIVPAIKQNNVDNC
jgi:hypothetical protein